MTATYQVLVDDLKALGDAERRVSRELRRA